MAAVTTPKNTPGPATETAVRTAPGSGTDSGSTDEGTSRSLWRHSRWLPIVAVALYVAVPVLCSIYYATFPGGSFSLSAYSVITDDASLASAASRTLLIAVFTIAVLVMALVPAVVAIHLWAPRLRPVLEILCTLPLVVPPIALAAGVVALLRWGAQQGRDSMAGQISQFVQHPDLPLILVGTYVVLCLPFTFRSIDAGLRVIPLKAMVEGSASLGAGMWGTVWRVVLPNIRGPVLFAIFFATAVCLGEFAIAATLNRETIPVWLFTVSNTDFRASIAIAVLLNLTTWVLLLVATLSAGRFSAQGRGKRAAPDLGSDNDAAGEPSSGTTAGTATAGTPQGATTPLQKELR